MKKLIIFTAALALLAGNAFAVSMVGGPHDLSGQGVGNGTDSTDELCVFCHTPHAAQSGVMSTTVAIPLANRTTTGSAFCMSCHDGSVQYADIVNPSNADAGAGAGATYNFAGNGNFGADLTAYAANNHPVGAGAVYSYADTALMGANTLIANDGDTVECATCHQVHSGVSPLLQIVNTGSNLCLECHNK